MGVILGDQVVRIHADNKGMAKKMTVSNNIELKDVIDRSYSFVGDKKPGLALKYTYTTKYGDTGSKIETDIMIFFSGDKKEIDEIMNTWKEKKALNDKFVLPISNRVLEVGMLQAIAIADQLKMMIPVKLPKFVKPKAATKDKVKAG